MGILQDIDSLVEARIDDVLRDLMDYDHNKYPPQELQLDELYDLGLKIISSGEGRKVYDIGDGRVLKVAKDKSEGVRQNNKEISVWEHAPRSAKKRILCPILGYDEWPSWWIVMAKAEKVSKRQIADFFGTYEDNLDTIHKMVHAKWAEGNSRFGGSSAYIQWYNELENQEWLDALVDLFTKENDLDLYDALHPSNLGWLNGRLVIIDYGFERGKW